jgi:hypothetical protein
MACIIGKAIMVLCATLVVVVVTLVAIVLLTEPRD